jgi:hypothetical protein
LTIVVRIEVKSIPYTPFILIIFYFMHLVLENKIKTILF